MKEKNRSTGLLRLRFLSEATFPRLGGDFVASAKGAERRNRGGDNLPLLIPFSLDSCSFFLHFYGKIFILFYYYLILSILFLYQVLIPWSPSFDTIHSKFSYHFSKFSYRKTEMKVPISKKSFFSKVVCIGLKCRSLRPKSKI